jgi:hypothetical protein
MAERLHPTISHAGQRRGVDALCWRLMHHWTLTVPGRGFVGAPEVFDRLCGFALVLWLNAERVYGAEPSHPRPGTAAANSLSIAASAQQIGN